jgi:bla regulator protein BlaR1
MDATVVDLVVDSVARASWQAGVLTLAVAAICLAFRRLPARWQAALWLVVLARLCLPAAPSSSFSLFNAVETHRTADNPPEANGRPPLPGEPNAAIARVTTTASATPAEIARTATPHAIETSAGADLKSVALGIWLLGVIGMATHWFVLHVRLRRWLNACRIVTAGSSRQLLNRCCRECGIVRPVLLLVSDDATPPALCGLLRPRIIVSAAALERLGETSLTWVFRHELVHLKRHDLTIQHLWCCARALHWFNPLVWYAARRSRAESELACDEATLAVAEPSERVSYAQVLLQVAEQMATTRPATGTVAFLARRSTLSKRVDAIARFQRPSKLATFLAAGLLCALGAAGLTDAMQVVPPPAPQVAAPKQDAAPPTEMPTNEARPNDDHSGPDQVNTKGFLRVQVVDEANRPLPGAKLHASIWTVLPFEKKRDYTCDAEGKATIELPETLEILRIWARSYRRVPLVAKWWPKVHPEDAHLPQEFTFRMPKGTSIGGVIKNDEGQPIDGARVEVRLVKTHGLEYRDNPEPTSWLANEEGAAVTDYQGRWNIDNVPPGDDVEVLLMISHRQYYSDSRWGESQQDQKISMGSLRDQTGTIVLHRGITVSGRVTNPEGNPVDDAVVVWSERPYEDDGEQETLTSRNGSYRLPPLPRGPRTITVVAEGWAPAQQKVDLKLGENRVDFQMQPGKTLKVRFVTSLGRPIPGVNLAIERWRGKQALYSHRHPDVLDQRVPCVADGKGEFIWTWAPDDPVTFNCYFSRSGFKTVTLTANDEEQVVELP